MKRIAAVRRSARCLSSAVLTLQCAGCPPARHFVVRDACHEHCAQEYSAPAGAGSVPRSGAAYFAHGGKVGKTPLETKVSRLPFFAEDFIKRIAAVRRSARCLSSCRTDFPRTPAPGGPRRAQGRALIPRSFGTVFVAGISTCGNVAPAEPAH